MSIKRKTISQNRYVKFKRHTNKKTVGNNDAEIHLTVVVFVHTADLVSTFFKMNHKEESLNATTVSKAFKQTTKFV